MSLLLPSESLYLVCWFILNLYSYCRYIYSRYCMILYVHVLLYIMVQNLYFPVKVGLKPLFPHNSVGSHMHCRLCAYAICNKLVHENPHELLSSSNIRSNREPSQLRSWAKPTAVLFWDRGYLVVDFWSTRKNPLVSKTPGIWCWIDLTVLWPNSFFPWLAWLWESFWLQMMILSRLIFFDGLFGCASQRWEMDGNGWLQPTYSHR